LLAATDNSDQAKAKWACYWLGRSYEFGIGGSVDADQAKSWYAKEQQRGNTSAKGAVASAAPGDGATPRASGDDRMLRASIGAALADYAAATESKDASAAKQNLQDVIRLSGQYLENQPNDRQVWLWRAAASLELNLPIQGGEAGRKLKELGILKDGDDKAVQVMGTMDHKGWMRDPVVNSLGMTLASIPPGEFVMGSPPGEAGHRPDETQHTVKLSKPFLMGTTHVTRGQFAAFVNDGG
jgi:hypothetical protein